MDIKPIKTEADYEAALAELDALFDAEPDTPAGDRFEVLAILVETYEEKHHKISLPDPIEAIEYHMERLGLSRKDLEPYIGQRGRVSEILGRKRALTLEMIRNLEKGLGIPAEILVQEYEINPSAMEYKVNDVAFLLRGANAGGPAERQMILDDQTLEATSMIFPVVAGKDAKDRSEAIPVPDWPTSRFAIVTGQQLGPK